MKKLGATLVAGAACLFAHSAMAETITIIGDENYSPYIYGKGTEAKGIYADILMEASKRMPNYDIEIKLMPWKRALKVIENGKEFAFAPPYYRPKARPFISPYSEPLLAEELVVVCNTKTSAKLTGANFPEDFYGLKFAHNSGFQAGGEAFVAAVKAGKIELHEHKKSDVNLKKVVKGRADCYINDRLAIQHTAKEAGLDTGKLKEVKVLTSENGYVGYSKAAWPNMPHAEGFSNELNKTILEMKADGTIDKLLK